MSTDAIKVLLVEDDRAFARLVERILISSEQKFEVSVAGFLRDAKDCVLKVTPDIVLADMYLPDGKGIELLSVQSECAFPLVILTGQGSEETAVEVIKAGALDYVVKSSETVYDMPHVVKRALGQWHNILERKRAEHSLREAHDELEKRVEDRMIDLQLANEMLRRQLTKRINAEKELVAYQQKLRSLTSKLTLTEDHERRRIASGLHDNIIQPLIFLKIKLDSLMGSGESCEIDDQYVEMKGIIDDLVKMTRSFTFDLSYPILHELGLEPAIDEWLKQEIQEKHGLTAVFATDDADKPLDDDMRSLLFEAVKELLINMVKHAGAQQAKVTVSRKNDLISICVEDDGVGFGSSELTTNFSDGSGFGLFSIRERLSYLGGNLAIESQPGRGSRIILEAPLKKETLIQERC